ncbi:uncharacterized protein ISCGN_021158 [Ixodes scapularis]
MACAVVDPNQQEWTSKTKSLNSFFGKEQIYRYMETKGATKHREAGLRLFSSGHLQKLEFSTREAEETISHPFLGASPDGIVSCSCCEKRLIEIKCPRNSATFSKSELHDGHLKPTSKHYAQVQMQMGVTGRKLCILFVYCSKDDYRQVSVPFGVNLSNTPQAFVSALSDSLPGARWPRWDRSLKATHFGLVFIISRFVFDDDVDVVEDVLNVKEVVDVAQDVLNVDGFDVDDVVNVQVVDDVVVVNFIDVEDVRDVLGVDNVFDVQCVYDVEDVLDAQVVHDVLGVHDVFDVVGLNVGVVKFDNIMDTLNVEDVVDVLNVKVVFTLKTSTTSWTSTMSSTFTSLSLLLSWT